MCVFWTPCFKLKHPVLSVINMDNFDTQFCQFPANLTKSWLKTCNKIKLIERKLFHINVAVT